MNAVATLSDPTPARQLAAVRAGVLGQYPVDAPAGAALRRDLTAAYEGWLKQRAAELGIDDTSGFAIVAVGTLGRGEMMPGSDLDLVLVHDERHPEVLADLAEGLWYPIWDSGIGLDHSVRSIPAAIAVAQADPTAALGLLDARWVAGDADLAALLIASVRNLWRVQARQRLPEILELARGRWDRAGAVAQHATPDLKNGRGGLRDGQLLGALALAQLTDGLTRLRGDEPGSPVAVAYRQLLDVRTQHQLITGRSRDRIQAQDADQLAAALGLGDRFDLSRLLSDSGRTVDFAVDTGVRTASAAVGRRGLARLRGKPVRRPLDEGVVEHGGEVTLARSALPSTDEGLVLRVAAAAAHHDLPIHGPTLERLACYGLMPSLPWAVEPLRDLLVLLAAGPGTARTIEALDRIGLWERLFPEWTTIRDLPPRDAVHTWTVDRHSVETVIGAAALTTTVSRPDLLLLGALIHDIGKGRDRDHSEVGAELAVEIGRRLGLWPEDVAILAAVVRHHLLLPSTATRRDPTDPAVVEAVAQELDHNRVVAELLGALAQADGAATGPAVWSDWKAGLVAALTARVVGSIGGTPVAAPEVLTESQRRLAEAGGIGVQLAAGDGPTTYLVTMVAPDGPGLLSRMAGVLTDSGLAVYSAQVASHVGYAVNTFAVTPTFGDPPDVQVLRQRLRTALGGRAERVPARRPEASTRRAVRAEPKAGWVDSPAGPLLEVRAVDERGLLADIAAVLERRGLGIDWATVTTLGSTVIDTFAVTLERDTPAVRAQIVDAVLAVCPRPDAA